MKLFISKSNNHGVRWNLSSKFNKNQIIPKLRFVFKKNGKGIFMKCISFFPDSMYMFYTVVKLKRNRDSVSLFNLPFPFFENKFKFWYNLSFAKFTNLQI